MIIWIYLNVLCGPLNLSSLIICSFTCKVSYESHPIQTLVALVGCALLVAASLGSESVSRNLTSRMTFAVMVFLVGQIHTPPSSHACRRQRPEWIDVGGLDTWL
ncbi:hypothetical protein BDV97DRAFT_49273 [Delphinella strobiligena]|nr:hypothetical protein BDV97DRAFT_49273 [Delphinella strobiligena]